MIETVRTCATCGESFWGKGRAKFCSSRCRKAQYATPCAACGAATSGSEGSRPGTLCGDCGPVVGGLRAGQIHRARALPRWEALAQRWREGATLKEIADEFGMAPHTVGFHISTLRAKGFDVPYRHNYPSARAA